MRSARQIITAVVVLAFSGAFAGGCAPTAGTVLAAAAQKAWAEQKDSGEKGGVGQTVNDVWIETKIKAKLLTASGVTSVNFFWRSVRNTVYVIGRARSTGERDKVLAIIRGTDGVKGVKHFIQIKPAG